MNKAEDQCEKMIRCYPRHVDKTVMILTDKWDAPLFKGDYAGTFINYANRENIVFIFLLITDFVLLSMHKALLFRGYKNRGCFV